MQCDNVLKDTSEKWNKHHAWQHLGQENTYKNVKSWIKTRKKCVMFHGVRSESREEFRTVYAAVIIFLPLFLDVSRTVDLYSK